MTNSKIYSSNLALRLLHILTWIFVFKYSRLSVAAEQYRILVLSDEGDNYTTSIVRDLSVANLFYADRNSYGDNLSMVNFTVPANATNFFFCEKIANASLIINVCRRPQSIKMISNISSTTGIPVIRIHYDYWNLPLNYTGDLNFTDVQDIVVANTSTELVVIPPTTVFQNVITDIFPSLNIVSSVTVLYDDLYDNSYTEWEAAFSTIPGTVFYPMESRNESILSQIKSLYDQATNVFLVGKTTNIERFVYLAQPAIEEARFSLFAMTKDISPFKCDICESVQMYWIRPYYTGETDEISQINAFLVKNEIGVDIDYAIAGYQEVDVAFYVNIYGLAVTYLNDANETDMKMYTCEEYTVNSSNTTLRDVALQSGVHEYGPYVEYQPNVFFQNVPVRIFHIDRNKEFDENWINKQVGNWTITDKLYVFYDTLSVDVRSLNIYRIVTVIQPPFVQYSGDPENPYEGYCIDLINLVKDEVNFTYTIYEVTDGLFGSQDANGNWNGLMAELVSGSADIILAPMSVMAERETDIDFTVPYYDLVGTTILMKKADVEYSLFKFMKVLEWPVWVCIIAAYVVTSMLLYGFERFSPYSFTNNKERYKFDNENRIFTLKECLWFCMTSLTPQGGGEAPKNISGRLVAATWWLFGFIIIASYTANLAAFLTVSRLEQPISSLDDLAKQYKIEYAPVQGTATETYFKRMAEIEEQFYNIWKDMSLNESMSARERAKMAVWDYPVSDKFTNMWRYMLESGLPKTMDEAVNRVLNSVDGFAYIGDATEIKYAVLTDCRLQQVGTEFSRKPYAIAVQSGSELKDEISGAILMLLNQRRLETLKEKWWNENPNKVNCPDVTDESDGISIQNIGGVFIVILAGIVLSIVTLIFEYIYYRRKTKNSLDIQSESDDKATNSTIGEASTFSSKRTESELSRRKPKITSVASIESTTSAHSIVNSYENSAFQY